MTDFTLTQLLPHWRPAQLEQLADELRYCYRPTLTDEELTTMLTRQLQQHQRRYLQFNRHYQQLARHYQQTQEHYSDYELVYCDSPRALAIWTAKDQETLPGHTKIADYVQQSWQRDVRLRGVHAPDNPLYWQYHPYQQAVEQLLPLLTTLRLQQQSMEQYQPLLQSWQLPEATMKQVTAQLEEISRLPDPTTNDSYALEALQPDRYHNTYYVYSGYSPFHQHQRLLTPKYWDSTDRRHHQLLQDKVPLSDIAQESLFVSRTPLPMDQRRDGRISYRGACYALPDLMLLERSGVLAGLYESRQGQLTSVTELKQTGYLRLRQPGLPLNWLRLEQ